MGMRGGGHFSPHVSLMSFSTSLLTHVLSLSSAATCQTDMYSLSGVCSPYQPRSSSLHIAATPKLEHVDRVGFQCGTWQGQTWADRQDRADRTTANAYQKRAARFCARGNDNPVGE